MEEAISTFREELRILGTSISTDFPVGDVLAIGINIIFMNCIL